MMAKSFNPKPKAMVVSGIDHPHATPAIAFGFGLNEPAMIWTEQQERNRTT